MKNIIQTSNFNMINKLENKKLTLEQYGFIYYLSLLKENTELKKIFVDLNMNIEQFKSMIDELIKLDLLTVNINIEEYVSVKWEISYLNNHIDNQDMINLENASYLKIFILDDIQQKSVQNITDKKELFLRLYRIYESTNDKYILQDKLVINNESEYISYLKNLSPITILLNNKITPTVKDINLLFEVIYIKKVKVELVNFLIEYVITTSLYNNFSINYFITILNNWETNKINTLEEAMEYIKQGEEKKVASSNKYIEPSWDEVNKEVIEEDLEEIEKLLSKTNPK